VLKGLRRLRGRFGARRWTIGHELARLVLAALLPFAILGLYWTQEDYRTEQARSQTRALRLARQESASVDELVADTAALVEALARVPSVKRGEQPQSDQLLEELVERHPYYESLFVADSEGRILAAGGEEVPSERRRSYVAETLRSAGTVVTDAFTPGRDSRRLLVVTTALWDETGKPVGVVAASVGLLRLQEGLRRADLPENSSMLVVDRGGRIVTRRQDPEQWVGRSALDSSAVRDALRLGEGVSEGDFVDGVRRLSGFASPERVPWVVVVGVPTDEAYATLWRDVWRSLARLLLAGTIAVTAAWLLSRRLTRPVGRLAEAARAYAAGDLDRRTDVAGPWEMAALGDTLNRMAGTLQRQMAELEEARHRERELGRRALDELQRLHSEFVAIAAHELRTPVAAAKSYAELLLRDGVELAPETRRQALVRLDVVCERLARLVRSLLGASRIQAGRLELQCEPVDVATLVRRVLADVAAYTPGHAIRLRDVGDEPALALADAERVEDVLINLLANAGKYAPAGTDVEVEVVPAPGGPGAGVEVRVADQGPGIPADEQDAVFERFRRGRGVAAGGVGLGLYIARAYVEAMGGTIGVVSRPGHGATFWFRLPAPPDVADAADAAGRAGAADGADSVPRAAPAAGAGAPAVATARGEL
jgi:two-component system, OmpR family, sensor kinase